MQQPLADYGGLLRWTLRAGGKKREGKEEQQTQREEQGDAEKGREVEDKVEGEGVKEIGTN